jgi:lipopolysaccharide export system permease protein
MRSYQYYILKKYFKSFLIIFAALTMFFTGVDLITNLEKLPVAANLKIVYMFNIMLFFSSYILGLSIVFAMIATIINLVKDNEMVVLYSLGISKMDILKPFLFTAYLLTFIFISMYNFAFFVNSKQIASNIKHYGKLSQLDKKLFLKSLDKYIYIDELNRFKKEGLRIKIYELIDGDLVKVIRAKKGTFRDNYWQLEDVQVSIKRVVSGDLLKSKIEKHHYHAMQELPGFKPEIINSLYNSENQLTVVDSIKALNILGDKEISLDTIKVNLYKIIVYPFFAPLLLMILFFRLPIQRRGYNLALLSARLYFVALIVWGILFLFIRLSQNSSIVPEVGIVLPIALLCIYAMFVYKINKKSF